MRMTKAILTLTAALALSAPMLLAQADTQSAPPPPPMNGGPGGPGGHRGGDRMEMMEQKLNLTPEQRRQFRDIMKTAHEKGRAIHENTQLSDIDRRTQMRDNMRASHDQIRGILTDQQKQQFDQMSAEHREMRHDPMGGGAPPPPDASGAPQQ